MTNKNLTTQELIIYVLNKSENKSVLNWVVGLIALMRL